MTTTTQNGFNTVSQAGSAPWSGISNMPYPTEGEATVVLPASTQSSVLNLIVPFEATGISGGASFDSATLTLSVKQNAVDGMVWSGSTNLSSATAWTFSQSPVDTYQTINIAGDQSYWRVSPVFTPTRLITDLKSGAWYFTVWVDSGSGGTASIKSAVITIDYTAVSGHRGAIVAALL